MNASYSSNVANEATVKLSPDTDSDTDSDTVSDTVSDSTVIISGGGSGIGLATAQCFLAEGWRAIVIGRRLDPLQKLAREYPDQVLPISCDITKPDSVNAMIQAVRSQSKFSDHIRAIVNNAGIYERRSLKDSDDALWRSMFEVNFLGSVRLTKLFLDDIERNKGCVINVSSTLGVKPVAQTGAYSAFKAAMNNWTQTLALEISPSGARANCVCPGIVDTPIHAFHAQKPEEKAALGGLQPLGRIGKPSDVAYAIWTLCAPGSEWITGSILNVDGGISLA